MRFQDKPYRYVSVSRLKTLLLCGYRYGFQYLAGKRAPQTAPMEAGTIVHKALEEGRLEGINSGLELAQRAQQIISPKSPFKSMIQTVIDETLPAFHPETLWRDGQKTELVLMGETPKSKTPFKVIIDLVDEQDQEAILWDYKTDKKFNAKYHLFQGSVYKAVYEQLNPGRQAHFALCLLRLKKKIRLNVWKPEETWDYVEKLIELMRPEKLCPNTKSCYAYGNPCPYSNHCPHYRYGKK